MQLLDDNFFIAGQLNAKDFATAKDNDISLIINNRPDGEEIGILPVAEAQQLAEQHNMQYLHLPMANGQPLPEDLIPTMATALAEQEAANGKVLAHCRTGTRSSFLWGMIQIMKGEKSAEQIIQLGAQAGINLAGFAPVLQSLES